MAADSIAKLAVIITGDASPLSAALNKAKGDVTGWASGLSNMKSTPFGMVSNDGIDRWATGLRNLKSQEANVFEGLRTGAARYAVEAERATGATFKVATALQAARGNLGALASAGAAGGPLMWAVIGTAALGKFALESARAADRADVDASKIADAYEAAFEKLHGRKIDIGMNFKDTWSGATEELMSNMATIGRPLAHALAAVTRGWADDMEDVAVLFGMETAAQERKRLDILKQQTAEMNRQVEAREKAAKAAEEEARKIGEELERQGREMESRADALARSLRTPREEMVAAIAEASQLMEAGFLSAENFKRAAEEAKEKFREASNIRERSQSQAQQGIAAADRFTMAGFSAVQQGQRELQHIEQVAKEQLEEAKRQTEVEQEIAQILNDKLSTPIVLMEGPPP